LRFKILLLKMKYIKIVLFNLLLINVLNAQITTFDTDTDGWKVEGDAQNLTALPTFKPVGGNPDGYAFSKDDATGGVWFWTAPKKYLGNKCNAYGKKFSFDLFTNDLSKPFDNSDIIIASPFGILYYDTPNNPGLIWTKYSVKLDETDNWRYNSLSGQKPTKAQFQQVLMEVTAIKIRGEYRVGPDEGGLDNVVLEGEVTFILDADQSSKAKYGDFNTDTICGRDLISLPLCDKDLSFNYVGAAPKELTITFVFPTISGTEKFIKYTTTPNITASTIGSTVVANTSKVTDSTEIKTFVKSLRIEFDPKLMPEKFYISISVQTPICVIIRQITVITIKKRFDGLQKDTTLCDNSKGIYLDSLLNSNLKGTWSPATQKVAYFDPKTDKPTTFFYSIKAIDKCPVDSAKIKINIINLPKKFLGKDLSICNDSAFTLDVSNLNFDKYTWQDQSQSPEYFVTKAGIYTVKMQKKTCFTSDTINITTFNCTKCKFYAPNIFTPDTDGINDYFQIYSQCEDLQSYFFIIYDRWGNHVFETNKIEEGWDGNYRGKALNEGVYTYYMKAISDYKNAPYETTKKGDFMLIR
jgi:gliding motility-associated-like protein